LEHLGDYRSPEPPNLAPDAGPSQKYLSYLLIAGELHQPRRYVLSTENARFDSQVPCRACIRCRSWHRLLGKHTDIDTFRKRDQTLDGIASHPVPPAAALAVTDENLSNAPRARKSDECANVVVAFQSLNASADPAGYVEVFL